MMAEEPFAVTVARLDEQIRSLTLTVERLTDEIHKLSAALRAVDQWRAKMTGGAVVVGVVAPIIGGSIATILFS
jgi:hypothetical protein